MNVLRVVSGTLRTPNRTPRWEVRGAWTLPGYPGTNEYADTVTRWLSRVYAYDWNRLALVSMTAIGALFGLAGILGLAPLPGDAAFYWTNTPGEYAVGAYVYPPLLSQVLEPLRWFDAWQLYTIGWMALCFGSLGYVLGRWSFLAAALIVPDVLLGPGDHWWAGPIEAVLIGNVTMPMVAAMVLGMRHPGWWAVPLLTKITPGIGLAWFLFRGEWRRFAIGAVVTAAVFGVAFVLAPAAWMGFVQFAIDSRGSEVNGPPIVGPPLWVRLIAATLLIAWGARTNRPWVVPIAGAMALVGLYGWATFTSVAVGALAFVPAIRRQGSLSSVFVSPDPR